MDENLFAQHFFLDNVPHWPCPFCAKGILRLKEEDFQKEDNGETETSRSSSQFDFDWVQYVFHGLLSCNLCNEKVVFCGTGSIERDYDDTDHGSSYCDYFEPKYFHPTVRIIVIESEIAVPRQVLSSVKKACELFWVDLDSCANRIRTAVEYILDGLLIERYRNLTIRIPLHTRIDMLDATKYTDLKTVFEAVKWIGNVGTHELGGLQRESVIDGFRMLEHCLSVLYPKTPVDTAQIITLAENINKAKGQSLYKRK
ncbi:MULTISPECIES: DUF4145 domain-containing protein [unclassified Undibacterium]|uniref:DUF4145 domain-containing protein n=1 Tax=unclassified Undibacterium TaxID=2630295 RepID=UPI002AC9D0CB|nr:MULTISPECIES: DUF4145 domain-containing protein [unclassified Undibacterium]MEB0138685.1 DUF4145 domain-containing protein [Undibacterium sp. CCC2.1]MEB0171486.1 DUF4145 domain-containing protein [Undibacterium sp. CCC1.1]MEB0175443.1 DUF4145 domain-containing protein [Undibacterium sp. CCC3.4]MEB0214686.1 DUF4145 domain-containing protein [Undibacterium sp. 5I2]WPX43352.1 DUF4145 domain-containing protein [Undibacterium sp. CCC3.4]